jgi:WD repeat and SOF domain-containing protein 1
MSHCFNANDRMDVSFSPTGLEFVSGSYDRTLRVFGAQDSTSREVYHTNRMGRVMAAVFTADSKFILSGSDDHNIRLWKSNASLPIRPVTGPEKRKLDYGDKLKERYKHVPEVSKILRCVMSPPTVLLCCFKK